MEGRTFRISKREIKTKMKEKELIEIINGILNYIESKEGDLEYGYSWKQNFLKELYISNKLKKDLGLWSEK